MQTTLQTTTSGDSSEPRTTMRSSMPLLMAFGLIVGLIVMMATGGPAASCPEELIGTWNTAAQGYADSMLVMTKHAVVGLSKALRLEAEGLPEEIGEEAFVAAGAVVTADVSDFHDVMTIFRRHPPFRLFSTRRRPCPTCRAGFLICGCCASGDGRC